MTKRVVIPPFGIDAGPLTEAESALDVLEPAWADFAYALRPDCKGRVVRRPGNHALRTVSLDRVHERLTHYRVRLEGGDRAAIFAALVYCAEENVPMPYWLGTAVIETSHQLVSEPGSLHSLFGLDTRLPAIGIKASKARRDLRLRAELWHTACTIRRERGISTDAAIKQAREQLRFPYSQRKAREMFDLQEQHQRAYLRTNKKRSRIVHRI